MKIRYPQMGIALAVAALLAGTCAVSAYAVPEQKQQVLVLLSLTRQLRQTKATILCGKLKFQITIPAYLWFSMKKLHRRKNRLRQFRMRQR